MRVTALVSLAGLGVGNPSLAASAETTARVLEVGENVFHESSLSWEVSSASMEIAWELRSRSNRAPGLHCAASCYYSVLRTVHRVVEEVGVGRRHLGNWRSDRGRIRILFWAVSTGTWAHMAVLCRPGFEPVGADRATGTVGCNFVQVELDHKVSKGVEHISASLLRASKDGLAGRGVVDGHSTIVRFDILHLVTSQSLARDELGWR